MRILPQGGLSQHRRQQELPKKRNKRVFFFTWAGLGVVLQVTTGAAFTVAASRIRDAIWGDVVFFAAPPTSGFLWPPSPPRVAISGRCHASLVRLHPAGSSSPGGISAPPLLRIRARKALFCRGNPAAWAPTSALLVERRKKTASPTACFVLSHLRPTPLDKSGARRVHFALLATAWSSSSSVRRACNRAPAVAPGNRGKRWGRSSSFMSPPFPRRPYSGPY